MLDKIHDHIVKELGQSSRTDTIFVVTAILFNLVVLGVSSGISASAAEEGASVTSDLVLAVFILMTVLVNLIAMVALHLGRRTRRMLLDGLIGMYRDNHVEKYYDHALVSNYGTRYLLFGAVILTLGVTAIAVPLIVRLA